MAHKTGILANFFVAALLFHSGLWIHLKMNLHHRSSHNCMQAVKHQPTPASMGIHNPIQLLPCTNINTNSRNITIFINHRLTNQFFIWVASCLVLTHTNQAHTIRRIIMIQISIGVPCRSHRWRCREGSGGQRQWEDSFGSGIFQMHGCCGHSESAQQQSHYHTLLWMS